MAAMAAMVVEVTAALVRGRGRRSSACAHRRRAAVICLAWGVVVAVALFALLGGSLGCGRARRGSSFDEIRKLVVGATEAEVETRLGPPSQCRPWLDDGQVCVWQACTFLDGPQYPAAMQHQVVSLAITFKRPPVTAALPPPPLAVWRVADPFAVNYSLLPVSEAAVPAPGGLGGLGGDFAAVLP
jgi:hypothetical protein